MNSQPATWGHGNVWVWAAAKDHVWFDVYDPKGYEDRAAQNQPTPHWLQHSGKQAMHLTWVAQQS